MFLKVARDLAQSALTSCGPLRRAPWRRMRALASRGANA